MGVGDSGHRVDFEVLVGAARGHSLNWSPVSEGWLGIVEPLIAQVLHVIVVDVGHSLGDLASGQSATKLQHVLADLGVDGGGRLRVEQCVVEVVSAADHLNVVDVVTVDGWQANTAVVHLSGEDLVSKEVVAEDTAVGVGEVVRLGSGDVWVLSEQRVHRVVLL